MGSDGKYPVFGGGFEVMIGANGSTDPTPVSCRLLLPPAVCRLRPAS